MVMMGNVSGYGDLDDHGTDGAASGESCLHELSRVATEEKTRSGLKHERYGKLRRVEVALDL